MFYGRGAGELPTASAVVGDVFEIARNIKADCCGRIGCTCYKEIPVKKMATPTIVISAADRRGPLRCAG